MLTWPQVGDLHASDEDGWDNLARLAAMIDDLGRGPVDGIDVVVLPGDNANHDAVR